MPQFSTDLTVPQANQTLTGAWFPMQDFVALGVGIAGDQLLDEVRVEWSPDKQAVSYTNQVIADFNPVSTEGTTLACVVARDAYARVVVVNGNAAQGAGWGLTVVLYESAPAGNVTPLASFPYDLEAAQTVRAVLYGRVPGLSDPQYTQVLVDSNGFMVASSPPLPTTNFGQRIPATLTSTLVGSFNPEGRDSLSIFNSSTEGNMYVRLGLPVDVALSEWDYRVPPGGLWVAPRWGGDIEVAWDNDVDGFGHVQEVYS